MTRDRGRRIRLQGTKSNRDASGALVRVFSPDGAQLLRVKTGSSYLSQSEMTLTLGLGKRDAATDGDRVAELDVGADERDQGVARGRGRPPHITSAAT